MEYSFANHLSLFLSQGKQVVLALESVLKTAEGDLRFP